MDQNSYIYKPHFIWIFIKISQRFKELILGFIFLNTLSYFSWIKGNSAIKIIFILLLIFSLITVLEWKSISYEVNRSYILARKGVFNKRNTLVKLNNINNLSSERNLLHILFNLQTLKITADTNNNMENLELEYLKICKSNHLSQLISDGEKITNNKTSTKQYRVDLKSLVINSFISLKLFMVVPLYFFITSSIKKIIDIDEILDNYLNKFIEMNYLNLIIVSIIIITLSIVYGIIYNLFFLKDFVLEISDSYIKVTSGFIKKKNSYIERQRIGSIILTQNFVERILGFSKVKCVTFSNDNQNNAETLLFPTVRLDNDNKIIRNLGLTYLLNKKEFAVPFRSLFPKLIRLNVLISFMILINHLFSFSPYYLYIFIILIVTNSILKYVYDRIGFNVNDLYITNGGVFWNKYFVKRDKIEFIKITQSFMQRILNISTISIMIRDNPYKIRKIKDIDSEIAINFKNWYEGVVKDK